jgi:divalent metal cation (Fe/Co/Zn/Cd) transporter
VAAPHREDDLRSAVIASAITVGWDAVVGVLAIATAVVTGAVALLAFGFDASVDAIASVLLIRRFSMERRDPEGADRLEHVALGVVGSMLVFFGALVIAGAIRSIVRGHGPEVSGFAIAQAAASILVLPTLAMWKHRLAGRLGSRALRGDAVLTAAGAALAFVALIGLVLDDALGWWWSDPLAAVAIALFLCVEGVRALALRRQAGR